MRKDKSNKDFDDNRTIAPMDVDGMEYNPFGLNFSRRRTPRRAMPEAENQELILTKKEKRALRRAAFLLAFQVCLVAGVLMLAVFLFIRFVWLRGW